MSLLVLITGTGRSGTSTMSGTLHHLGLSVPGPYLGANDSNPKGFFESKWSVRFHKQITAAAGIKDFDARPGALAKAQGAVTPQLRDQLAGFLAEHAAEEQLVVKDPRTVWAQELWREMAAEAGRTLVFISMLRHPAEVIGSRTTYYAKSSGGGARRRYETLSVARWLNSSLISERGTRGTPRAFVRYPDLLDDWRPVLRRLRAELGLRYAVDIDGPTPVDDFIDPGLRRHQVRWDELEVPDRLRQLADRVWADLNLLVDRGGVDEDASADLDEVSAAYAGLFAEAAAIAHDATDGARLEGIAEGRAEGAAAAAAERPRRPALAGTPPAGPLVERTGSRELLRVVARRARARARRWLPR